MRNGDSRQSMKIASSWYKLHNRRLPHFCYNRYRGTHIVARSEKEATRQESLACSFSMGGRNLPFFHAYWSNHRRVQKQSPTFELTLSTKTAPRRFFRAETNGGLEGTYRRLLPAAITPLRLKSLRRDLWGTVFETERGSQNRRSQIAEHARLDWSFSFFFLWPTDCTKIKNICQYRKIPTIAPPVTSHSEHDTNYDQIYQEDLLSSFTLIL